MHNNGGDFLQYLVLTPLHTIETSDKVIHFLLEMFSILSLVCKFVKAIERV